MQAKFVRSMTVLPWLLVPMVLLAGCQSLWRGIDPAGSTPTVEPAVMTQGTGGPAGEATATPSEAGLAPAIELTPLPTETRPAPTLTPEPSATSTSTTEPSPTATGTHPPTDTPERRDGSPTSTPVNPDPTGPAPSPTYDFPDATIQMQANCRYGPGKAYLYSHGMYAGDRAEVHGRNYSGGWLWIKPENLNRHCWAAASVMEVAGDVSMLEVVQTQLPKSTLYGPPQEVWAERDGDLVRISWESVWMTEDDYRGYLIEATVCQNGVLVWVAVSVDGTSYEMLDEERCSPASSGQLYTVEKHGYTDPVPIPWPE